MSIAFTCPTCGSSMRFLDKMAGKKIRCPDCKEVVELPVMELEAVDVTPRRSGRPRWPVFAGAGIFTLGLGVLILLWLASSKLTRDAETAFDQTARAISGERTRSVAAKSQSLQWSLADLVRHLENNGLSFASETEDNSRRSDPLVHLYFASDEEFAARAKAKEKLDQVVKEIGGGGYIDEGKLSEEKRERLHKSELPFQELDKMIRARHVVVVRYQTGESARRHLFEEKEKIELEMHGANVSGHFLLWGRFVFVGDPEQIGPVAELFEGAKSP